MLIVEVNLTGPYLKKTKNPTKNPEKTNKQTKQSEKVIGPYIYLNHPYVYFYFQHRSFLNKNNFNFLPSMRGLG